MPENSRMIYVSPRGNDYHDGLTRDKPIRTLKAAVDRGLSEGDVLLLESGQVFDGHVRLKNVNGVTIGSYGPGQPVIRSGSRSGIVLEDCQDIVLAGIKLIGTGWRVCNNSRGVLLKNCDRVLVENVEVTEFHAGGICADSSRDVKIIGCFTHDNGSVGIRSGGNPECENVRIAYCRSYDNAGDYANRKNHSGNGIIIGNTNHAVVEFCETAGNGWAQRQTYVNGPVGIWCCCGARDVVFRWNISRHNRTQPGAVDGDGLDIDGEVQDGVMEFNYTYGNEGSGYLLCEFWGDCTDLLWENNVARYNVSFEDATRVNYCGPIHFWTPHSIPFERMVVEKNLFTARKGLHAVYNRDVPETVKQLNVTDNVFITDGTKALYNPDDPYTRFENNIEFLDNSVREDITKHAPMLTNPRDLLKQPVFKLLESGACADVLRTKGASALFTPKREGKGPEGLKMLILRMDGLDLEGCDKSGDLRLYYDSIKPGISTKLSREGDQFYTPIPWWSKGRRYIVRAKARLQSPDVKACLFMREDEGQEEKVYFAGPVSEYGYVELEFTAEHNNWNVPGKYLGVRHEGGHGCVFVDSIELIELPQENAYQIDKSLNSLQKWNAFGDCESTEEAFGLNGFASGIRRTIQSSGRKVHFTVSCKAVDCQGLVFADNGGQLEQVMVSDREWTRVTLTVQPLGDSVDLGVWHSGNAGGQLLVKDIEMKEEL